METDWISIKAPPGVYEMECEKPKNVKYFLVIIGVKGGRDEKEIVSFGARGIGLLVGEALIFVVYFFVVYFLASPQKVPKRSRTAQSLRVPVRASAQRSLRTCIVE